MNTFIQSFWIKIYN